MAIIALILAAVFVGLFVIGWVFPLWVTVPVLVVGVATLIVMHANDAVGIH